MILNAKANWAGSKLVEAMPLVGKRASNHLKTSFCNWTSFLFSPSRRGLEGRGAVELLDVVEALKKREVALLSLEEKRLILAHSSDIYRWWNLSESLRDGDATWN
jgi:hypothetical protein